MNLSSITMKGIRRDYKFNIRGWRGKLELDERLKLEPGRPFEVREEDLGQWELDVSDVLAWRGQQLSLFLLLAKIEDLGPTLE